MVEVVSSPLQLLENSLTFFPKRNKCETKFVLIFNTTPSFCHSHSHTHSLSHTNRTNRQSLHSQSKMHIPKLLFSLALLSISQSATIRDFTEEDFKKMVTFIGNLCHRDMPCDDGLTCVLERPQDPKSYGKCLNLVGYGEKCGGRGDHRPVCDPSKYLYCVYPPVVGPVWNLLGIKGICDDFYFKAFHPPLEQFAK